MGWIDLEALGYYQERQGRRRTPPERKPDEPVQPGKLPFAPQIDVKDGDIDNFLSELDKLIVEVSTALNLKKSTQIGTQQGK